MRNQLTIREYQVADLIAKSLHSKEIATILGISPLTVKNHTHNILDKLELRSRVEIALYIWRLRGVIMTNERECVDKNIVWGEGMQKACHSFGVHYFGQNRPSRANG